MIELILITDKMWKRASILIAFGSLAGVLAAQPVRADDTRQFSVDPATFVGKAGDCGAGYAAGSDIVTAAWLRGMGLPDNGGQNRGTNPADNPNKQDPHKGLLVSKNGPTPDCSASGATLKGVKGTMLTEIGFDIRNGTHCGAGAPRFDVQATDGFHFLGGCANGTPTPAPQDPTAWTRVRIDPANPAQAFPPIAPGSKIISISITYDEGTDAGPGAGLAVLDNIDVNGVLVGNGDGADDNGGQGKGH